MDEVAYFKPSKAAEEQFTRGKLPVFMSREKYQPKIPTKISRYPSTQMDDVFLGGCNYT